MRLSWNSIEKNYDQPCKHAKSVCRGRAGSQSGSKSTPVKLDNITGSKACEYFVRRQFLSMWMPLASQPLYYQDINTLVAEADLECIESRAEGFSGLPMVL